MRQVAVDEAGEGQRLDNFLLRHLKGVPKTHVYRIIRSGEVRVNKARAQADTRLALGDTVRIPPVRTAQGAQTTQATRSAQPSVLGADPQAQGGYTPAREFPVLFEDEAVLAIHKPAGVAVHGGSGVAHGVIEQLRQARPGARFLELVHRLDKETSGVLLLAKERSALVHLQDQFRRSAGQSWVHKVYAALVWGQWPARQKVVDLALHKTLDGAGERHVRVVQADHPDGRRSISLVKVQQAWPSPEGSGPGVSLVDVTLKTGRTHQIRVHLAHHGHPIVGDPKYGDFALNRQWARGPLRFGRMFLHARELAFDHPVSGERVTLEAPLPNECATLLARLPTAV
ncbi:MAG: RluA family pseudouridine synthase [Betaproteobacteria bacterium]